jgi:hypothetical protein
VTLTCTVFSERVKPLHVWKANVGTWEEAKGLINADLAKRFLPSISSTPPTLPATLAVQLPDGLLTYGLKP